MRLELPCAVDFGKDAEGETVLVVDGLRLPGDTPIETTARDLANLAQAWARAVAILLAPADLVTPPSPHLN